MKRNTFSQTARGKPSGKMKNGAGRANKIKCSSQPRGILSALNVHEKKLLNGSGLARRNNAGTLRFLRSMDTCSDHRPGIAIVHIGDNPDDRAYRCEISKQANRIGMPVYVHGLPLDTSEGDVAGLISHLNSLPQVSGILIQTIRDRALRKAAHASLSSEKDPEGITATHTQRLAHGEGEILPCTPAAIRLLIKAACGGDLSGKTVAIVNSSPVIGLPLTQILAYDGATITLCNRQTKDLARSTRDKDVLVAAIGATNVIGPRHVGRGQIVIDAAIVRQDDGRVMGCVQMEKVIDKVSRITPVPFGVGPVTTSILLDNTAKLFAEAARRRSEKNVIGNSQRADYQRAA